MSHILAFFKKPLVRNYANYLIVGFVTVVFSLLSVTGILKMGTQFLLEQISIAVLLAVSLCMVVGFLGELSLGHAGFMCVGAFLGGKIAQVMTVAMGVSGNNILAFLLAMLTGGLVAAAFGFIIGLPALRLRGDYLAIVTLAFGEILKNIIGNLYVGMDAEGLHMSAVSAKFQLLEGGKMLLDGPVGATGITKISSFAMGYVLILFTLFVVLNLVNSKEGRAIKAVRDNRIAAESVGINVTAFRMKAFVVSAFLAGMAGVLFGLNMSSLAPAKFNFNTSINILVFVVLGGMGNILGSVISATVLYILPEALRELEDYRMILYAIVLIVVMLATWSPKFKNLLDATTDTIKTKIKSVFRKKEVTDRG